MAYKIPLNVLDAVDHHFRGGFTAWKTRHAAFVQNNPHAIEALEIVAVQLFISHLNGHVGAEPILRAVINCRTSAPCFRTCCPYCRTVTQMQASTKAVSAFDGFQAEELKFVTILLPFETDGAQAVETMKDFRSKFSPLLRYNADALSSPQNRFKMQGAFEIDLKNIVTDWDSSPESRLLMRVLGYNEKHFPPQYLPHFHAIVGPINDNSEQLLNSLIEKALGKPLLPSQVLYVSLHQHRTKDHNLSRTASYMFKGRLQFADNVFLDNKMQKRTRYHTPFKGKVLLNYLKAVEAAQNFKGLKFDFGLSSTSLQST